MLLVYVLVGYWFGLEPLKISFDIEMRRGAQAHKNKLFLRGRDYFRVKSTENSSFALDTFCPCYDMVVLSLPSPFSQELNQLFSLLPTLKRHFWVFLMVVS